MLQVINQLHDIANNENLKLAPEKDFFMLLTVTYFGHEFGFNTIKPIQSENAASHRNPSPTTKIELMRSIGSMNFYSKLFDKLHVNMKPCII